MRWDTEVVDPFMVTFQEVVVVFFSWGQNQVCVCVCVCVCVLREEASSE